MGGPLKQHRALSHYLKKTMLRSPLQLSNFRWLWFGQTFIFSASQFWFVALTWLVLQKTGSGITLGTVLMATAIPRGLLILLPDN
ncbi:hypothetical protein [Nodularia chucula]|uniref:hypothetical protein n=1 Tax=Nodularia chucula TaxID=3093667 RepID=UPI0039C719C0